MAATETKAGTILELTGIDTDYDLGRQRKIHSIQFVGGAASDRLVVKNGSGSGPAMADLTTPNGSADQRIKYFAQQRFQPYVDTSASTLGTGHKVIIEFV